MQRLLIDGVQQADRWQHLGDADLLVECDFSVTLVRWREDKASILAHTQRLRLSLGTRLTSASDPLELSADIHRFKLIVIHSNAPADGRLFSIAARLREHLNYREELRASGEIGADQLVFMQRCGINAFELPESINIEHLTSAYQRFYQSAGSDDEDNIISSARRGLPSKLCD